MTCSDPRCTGVHSHKRRAELCPAARERERVYQHKRAHTEGTYRYNAAHGLGVAGLRRYLRERRKALLAQREEVVKRLAEVRAQIAQLEKEVSAVSHKVDPEPTRVKVRVQRLDPEPTRVKVRVQRLDPEPTRVKVRVLNECTLEEVFALEREQRRKAIERRSSDL